MNKTEKIIVVLLGLVLAGWLWHSFDEQKKLAAQRAEQAAQAGSATNTVNAVNGSNGLNALNGTNALSGLRFSMTNEVEAYRALHPYVRRPGPESELPILTPYDYHASTSPLVQILARGHHGVMLDAGDPLLDTSVLPVGIILSIVGFFVVTGVTALWFQRRELK